MKRAGNLTERIAEPDNLRLAFLKACRGKQTRADVLHFRSDTDRNLDRLRKELMEGNVNWGGYHSFQIYDPKQRTIHAPTFRARVAHHAMLNICEPVFESYQIHDSYACRKGRGLDPALKRAVEFSRSGEWFLKMDIRKYFDSIDHDILKQLLRRRFKDRILLRLFDSVIDTYQTAPGKGLPIGNLTSQFFANHYLALWDHHAKEGMGIRKYVRYMDDFVIWSSSRDALKSLRRQTAQYLSEPLLLEVNPECLNACNRGLPFLGYKVYPDGLRLSQRGRQRFRRKTKQYQRLYEAGIWDESDLARHMLPLLAFVKKGASRSFRERIFHSSGLCPEDRIA